MKLEIRNRKNEKVGDFELPGQFLETPRTDLVKKAVNTIQNNKRQPYGAFDEAGMRHSAELSRRRRKYRGAYGQGISRVPRKILSRRGIRFNWVGAVAPGTVGGRRAHPAKASKDWSKKINDKERRKAIRSALSAVILKDLAKERGHIIPETYPFILDSDFEKITKTKDVKDALKQLGFQEELERAEKKKIRAGKGKSRGRKYKKKKSLLLVVSERCELSKSGSNLPGVDVARIEDLNCELLAPGTHLGRATLFTKEALERMKERELFI